MPATSDPRQSTGPMRATPGLSVLLLVSALLPAASGGSEEGDPAARPADSEESRQDAGTSGSGTPEVDFHFRLRGRFLDETSELGDIAPNRLSIWSDTRIGSRVQVRASYDVGERRVHDLWVQYDLGGGFRARAGRSAPLWLEEFTEAPFGFQMVRAATGAALTQIRESGVFLFFDRAAYNARLHFVNGTGWTADDNDFKDVVASAGRTFEVGGAGLKLDLGHYEGREGPAATMTAKRQTGVHLDIVFGGGRFFRGAAYRREQYGREHFGGFARVRKRFPDRFWAALELGSESNNERAKVIGQAGYFLAGVRYELPWTDTHLAADWRWRFGVVSDQDILLAFQWILDFRDPAR